MVQTSKNVRSRDGKLKWSQDDPGIYQLSYAGVNQKTLTTGGSCQIQWAALKENDYKYPKTLDEYEKMIKSYLAAHPKQKMVWI